MTPLDDCATQIETPRADARGSRRSVDDVLREFISAWQSGDRPLAEAYIERSGESIEQSNAALRLIWEEVQQRRGQGEAVSLDEMADRFPQYRGLLGPLLSDPIEAAGSIDIDGFPTFEIVTELGRGSGGRVYLARQKNLANRLVVLKVVPSEEVEHLSLARLQHTNIVPLYGVVDEPRLQRRALCMPYFGSTTLFHILTSLEDVPIHRRSARDIERIIQRREADLPIPPPTGNLHPFLRPTDTFVQAMCRVTAALAEALADAHQANLVHLDIKPSNVLVTTAGTPMLLDFHLARAPLRAEGVAPASFGGTPPFMSPEQRMVCVDVECRQPIRVDVDHRADIFSLGMLLCVALADAAPGDGVDVAIFLRERNRDVSVGLADIVARCLAPRPEDRYPNARQLAEDLRRHVFDEPLAHVPNRSLAERWSKWRRRRPHSLAIAALSAILFVSAIAGAGFVQKTFNDRRQAAETLFGQGQAHLADNRFDQAIEAFHDARETLPPTSNSTDLRSAIDRGLAIALRSQYVNELAEVVDAMRLARFNEPIDYRSLIVLEVNSKSLWDRRAEIFNDRMAPVDPRLHERLRRELTDLAVDRSILLPRLAPAEKAEEYAGRSLVLLEEARRLSPSPRVIDWFSPGQIDIPHDRNAWESYMLGRALMRRGEFERALGALQDAARDDPAEYWANFALGACALRLGRLDVAIPPLSVCIGVRPLQDAPYVRRGDAFRGMNRANEAIADYSQALLLRPNVGAVLVKRGRAYLAIGRPAEAERDFRDALDVGESAAEIAPLLERAKGMAKE